MSCGLFAVRIRSFLAVWRVFVSCVLAVSGVCAPCTLLCPLRSLPLSFPRRLLRLLVSSFIPVGASLPFVCFPSLIRLRVCQTFVCCVHVLTC
eukprot:4874724-Prymnesium_polylepis.1